MQNCSSGIEKKFADKAYSIALINEKIIDNKKNLANLRNSQEYKDQTSAYGQDLSVDVPGNKYPLVQKGNDLRDLETNLKNDRKQVVQDTYLMLVDYPEFKNRLENLVAELN